MFKRDLSAALRRTQAAHLRPAPDRAAIKQLIKSVQRQAPPTPVKIDKATIDRLTAGAVKQVRTR